MAGRYNDILRDNLNDLAFGQISWTPPTQVYISLFITLPNETTWIGTEPNGGNYARVQVSNNKTTWTSSSLGIINNNIKIEFNRASSTWGIMSGFGIHDALTGGTLLAYGGFDSPRSINGGMQPLFPPNDMAVKLI